MSMKQKDLHGGNAFITEWITPPNNLSLRCHEVHVWRMFLKMALPQVKTLKQILSADELTRAGRFHFQKDRHQFVVTRGLLRLVLSKYLETEPKGLRFCYGPFGKPALEEKPAEKWIRFNTAHSRGLILFAFAYQREIGVDIEYMRSDLSVGDIAKEFFSKREVNALNALPELKRQKAFFAIWTQKEAYLKGQGRGLSRDLNSFEILFSAGNPDELPRVIDPRHEESHWFLMNIDADPEYAAALAAEGERCRIRLYQWESGS